MTYDSFDPDMKDVVFVSTSVGGKREVRGQKGKRSLYFLFAKKWQKKTSTEKNAEELWLP